jgi:O-antigen ligase
MLDSVALPKLIVLMVFSGLSLVALCVALLRHEVRLCWHPVLWLVLALLGWAVVSAFFSVSPLQSILGGYDSVEGLVALLCYTLVAFLAVQYVRSVAALRTVAMVAVTSGVLVSVYALLQFWGVDPLHYTGEIDRVISTFGNADMLGDYLVFPFALALGLAVSSQGARASTPWWLALALIGSALVVTATRGAWLGAAVVLTCIGVPALRRIWRTSHRQRIRLTGVSLAVLAAFAVFVAYARPLANRGLTLSSAFTGNANGRWIIWRTGLRGWLVHPLTGWGPDQFGRAFERSVGQDWYALVGTIYRAENAHNFLLQTLVTLGAVGLLLTVAILGIASVRSANGLRSANRPPNPLLLAAWAAFMGMIVALIFGVTVPGVSAWLWLSAGLVLAPISHPVSAPTRGVFGLGAALGIACTLWAGVWLVGDVIAGRAMEQPVGPDKVMALQTAARLNPLSGNYRWLIAEATMDLGVAAQSAGQNDQTVETELRQGVDAFYVAAKADRGDAMVRVALANALLRYAAYDPSNDAVQRAVGVSLAALELAPRNPAVLVVLARTYQAAGRMSEAESTARLARSISPEYAAQTLGSLGLGDVNSP